MIDAARGAVHGAAVLLAIGASACALVGHGARGDAAAPADARIVLYRDRALVDEVIEADVRDGRAVLPLPADVAAEDVELSSADVHVRAWAATAPDGQRDVVAVSGTRTQAGRLLAVDETGVAIAVATGAGDELRVIADAELLAGRVRPALVAEVEGARRRARFHLRYPTTALPWQASYALVDRHGRARLSGALVLDNRTGRAWARAALTVIDAPAPSDGSGEPGPRAASLPGRYAIAAGAQRIELALRARPLALRSTLVYDPVGPALTRGSQPPERDPTFGATRWPAALDETVKLDLARVAAAPLPAGPVRLATAGDDGALRWRGEGELVPPAEDVERYLTIAVGRVDDVTGARRRTDFVVDDVRARLFEQFTITLTSTRTTPVEVLVREHLYRGPCWSLAYHSTGDGVAKEGAQQVALTTIVPAHGTASVTYRVVYHWSNEFCGSPSTSSN